MKTIRLTLTILVAALATAPAAGAASPDNKCLRWGDRYDTVQQTKFGLLFTKETSDGFNLYGCLYSTERSRPLGQQSAGLPDLAAIDGRYAAWFTITADEEDAFGYVTGIRVRDLKTGEVVSRAALVNAVVPGSDPNQTFPVGPPAAGQIVLRADGAVAWTAGLLATNPPHDQRRGDWEVQTIPARGEQPQTLDRGTELDPDSLARSRPGHRIYWTNGGQAKVAQFGR